MSHWGLELYKVYINDDSGLTLTYMCILRQCQIEPPVHLNGGKLLRSHLTGENLQQRTILTE